jgi:hypothetical protein
MRKLLYAGIAFASLCLHSCGPTHVVVETPPQAPPPPPPAPEVSYQSFYDALSPYGQWIDYQQYGYVWMPDVGPDFKPYATNGNWVYTDGGWTWASNYPWGWATFHYGRWFFEEGYGWMWIPGNEWAPAWVSWRQSPGYYGWAPLGPSVGINVSNGGGYNPPAHYWCFVPQQYVTSPHVNNYYVSEQQNVTIINTTTVIHNTTIVNNTVNNTTVVNNNVTNNRVTVNNYAGGPDPAEVSRVTGTPLRPVALRESNTPGESMAGGGLAIYRPRVNAAPQGSGASAAGPIPPHVRALTSVRPVNTTIYNNTNNRTTNNNTITDNATINNRLNIPAQGNSGTTPVQPTAATPPANAPQGQGFNHHPAAATTTATTSAAHPGQPVNPRTTLPLLVSTGTPSNPGTTHPLLSPAGTPSIPPTEHPLLSSAVSTASSTASSSNGLPPSKPAPKKVPPPPAKKKKPIPKNDNPQQQ